MTNQWNGGDYIDIADDDEDDDDTSEYYDPRDVKANFPKNTSVYGQSYQHDDHFPDDSRRSNQLYWSTEATKALIKIRGDREPEFEQGGASKSLLWVEIVKKMQSMGYNYSAEKISKKWHNIMITYNKNVQKKNQTGYVNWEFFDEIDVYFKHKREQGSDGESSYAYGTDNAVSATQILKRKSSSQDEISFYPIKRAAIKLPIQSSIVNESTELTDAATLKSLKYEIENLESEIDSDDISTNWWKEYFERKLELEREKMKKEQERHKDWMNFQKMTLMLQEKVEKIKVDAINSLTNAISKLVENKNGKNK